MYGGGGGAVVLGGMDAVRVSPYPSGQGEALGLFRTPQASSGHPIPGGGEGGDSRSSYPVDDVHQAPIAEDVGGGG